MHVLACLHDLAGGAVGGALPVGAIVIYESNEAFLARVLRQADTAAGADVPPTGSPRNAVASASAARGAGFAAAPAAVGHDDGSGDDVPAGAAAQPPPGEIDTVKTAYTVTVALTASLPVQAAILTGACYCQTSV